MLVKLINLRVTSSCTRKIQRAARIKGSVEWLYHWCGVFAGLWRQVQWPDIRLASAVRPLLVDWLYLARPGPEPPRTGLTFTPPNIALHDSRYRVNEPIIGTNRITKKK